MCRFRSTPRLQRPHSDTAIHHKHSSDSASVDDETLQQAATDTDDVITTPALASAATSFGDANNNWSFTRAPFKTSILDGISHELEDVCTRMFNSTLVYVGLESSGACKPLLQVSAVQLHVSCLSLADIM